MMAMGYAKISEFCDTGSGTTPSRQKTDLYYGGTIPWVKSGELRESIITYTEETVTDIALKETSLKLVPAGSLLVAMYGATVGRVGRLGIEATTNQAVCHIVPDPKVADEKYMFHALCAKAKELIAKSVGGAQPNINQNTIKETFVFLPPLKEQKRIAAILDQADDLRRKRHRAIDRLNQLGQAIFYEMFGDIKDYPLTTLGDLVQSFRYGTSNKSDNTGHPTLRIPNVIVDSIDLSDLKTVPVTEAEFKRLKLEDGDILFVRTNGNPDYVGRCAVYEYDNIIRQGYNASQFIYASYLIRARPKLDVLDSKFLAAFLKTPSGRTAIRDRSKTSAGQYNINTEGLGSIEVRLPPIQKQKLFSQHIASIQNQIRILVTGASQYENLFTSLQHRAFRGEL